MKNTNHETKFNRQLYKLKFNSFDIKSCMNSTFFNNLNTNHTTLNQPNGFQTGTKSITIDKTAALNNCKNNNRRKTISYNFINNCITNKTIKNKFLSEVERNIANFSPKNKNSITKKTFSFPIKRDLKNQFRFANLSKNTRQLDVLNGTNTKIISSFLVKKTDTFRLPPTKILTKNKIEEEKKFLEKTINWNKIIFDENTINEQLHLPKFNKKFVQTQEYINKLTQEKKIQNELKEDLKNSERWKGFEIASRNPSLGHEHLKKKFPDLINITGKVSGYENSFKRNYKSKRFEGVLVASRIGKEDDSYKYENAKNTKLTQMSKLKMKWKTIKWIIENRKDVLDRLIDFHERFSKAPNKKASEFERGFSKKEFGQIMKNNGITNDANLINKLFWVFDENSDNELRYQELAFGIEMFRESSVEQKLKAFYDLCDVDKSGTVSKTEFYDLLKKNIINNDAKISMKNIVDKIFSSVKLDKNGEITFGGLKEGCEKNKEIQNIIYNNLLALKTIDGIIDRDIKNDIIKFNPELNEQLRMKLLSTHISTAPLLEKKFSNLLDDFVSNKQKAIKMHKNMKEERENHFESFSFKLDDDLSFYD